MKKAKNITIIILTIATLIVTSLTAAFAAEVPEEQTTAGYDYCVGDVTRIQRILVEYESDSPELLLKYDVNKNDRIDIGDATLIQKHLAYFIDLNADENKP